MQIRKVCMGCAERYPACWGSCEKYKAVRDEYDAKLAKWKKERETTAAAKDLQFNSIERSRRRKGTR